MSWWWRQISALLLHSFTVCQLSRSDSLCIMCACQTPSDLILNSSYMLLLSEPRIIIDHSHQIYVFHMQSGSVGLCGHSAATESWLCDSAVGLWVLGMWKRCRLDCVTELCSGRRSLMKGGKQTDWQRKNRVHGDMGTWWTTKSALLPIAPWASWEMCMWESWHVSVCEYSLMLFFFFSWSFEGSSNCSKTWRVSKDGPLSNVLFFLDLFWSWVFVQLLKIQFYSFILPGVAFRLKSIPFEPRCLTALYTVYSVSACSSSSLKLIFKPKTACFFMALLFPQMGIFWTLCT